MTKEQCVAANTDGQTLRLDGKFAAARAALEACGAPSCPGIIRSDCTRRLDELDRAQPTIVFDAKDSAGSDVSAVSVTVDGEPLADQLRGVALRVDPGDHVFTFTAAGQPPFTRHFVIKEGEQARREPIVLRGSDGASSPLSTESIPALGSSREMESPIGASPRSGLKASKVLGLVAGGVGLVGIAVGSVFGVETFNAVNKQKADCGSATACPYHAEAVSEHSTVSTDSAIATTGFIAGGALLAAGALLFCIPPRQETSAKMGWAWYPGRNGGVVFLQRTF